MPRKSYDKKLTNQEVIELLELTNGPPQKPVRGRYYVDPDAGLVYGHLGLIYTYTNRFSDHLWCRIFKHPKYCCKAISHLVWMVVTRTPIPVGWHVHHRDLDPTNNSFDNLIALHRLDHSKLHQLEEAPF